MTRYGWTHYESRIEGECGSLWEAVEAGVYDDPDNWLKLRVGAMVPHKPSDYLTEEDVHDIAEDDASLSGARLLEMIDERHGERVWDGRAHADNEFLRRDLSALSFAEIAAAADEQIELDPSESCASAKVFPIELRGVRWTICGVESAEPDAFTEPDALVVYSSEPGPETGHRGWCWWITGHVGEAPTLKLAMEAVEKIAERKAHQHNT